MPKRNAFYAQSGGVTAVINASACGVIEAARRHRTRIGSVYAGRNGILHGEPLSTGVASDHDDGGWLLFTAAHFGNDLVL